MITSGIDNVPVYTDFQGLDKLKILSRDDPDKALEDVARQFESLFTQTLLKTMRDTSLADGIFDNDQSRLYQDLFDKQISTELSHRKGVGLADVLIRQLSPRVEQTIDAARQSIPAKNKFLVNDLSKYAKESISSDEFISPEDYLIKMYPLATEVEKSYGVPATVILAQSALETGWGKHVMKANDGSSSYNLFGIKADSRWQGEIARTRTVEYRDGIAETRRDNFRSYGSFEESMADYAQFLKSSPRYNHVMKSVENPQKFTIALK